MIYKKCIGSVDLNSILFKFQGFIGEKTSETIDAWRNNEKYGFTSSYRYPVKRIYSHEELISEPILPFIGVELFINTLLIYIKFSQDGLYSKCCSGCYSNDPTMERYLRLGEYTDWRKYLSESIDLMTSDELVIEDLLRASASVLGLDSNCNLSDDVIGYDASRERIIFYSYGSIYRLKYLQSLGYEIEEGQYE